jgi:hypothetical protein
MAAGSWIVFDGWKEYVSDGSADIDGDSFLAALVLTAATPSRTTWDVALDITNEAAGAGYARQPVTATWTEPVAGTMMFDAADFAWTASGGSWATW